MIYVRCGNDYTGDARLVITWTDPDSGALIDLTGADLWFAVKRKRTDIDEDALIFKTTADGIDIAADQTADRGVSYVTIDNDDTALLDPGAYYYAAQGKDATGRLIEIPRSRITIEGELIQATAI